MTNYSMIIIIDHHCISLSSLLLPSTMNATVTAGSNLKGPTRCPVSTSPARPTVLVRIDDDPKSQITSPLTNLPQELQIVFIIHTRTLMFHCFPSDNKS